MIVISVTQNNFQNGPGISDRLLGFYLELGIMVSSLPHLPGISVTASTSSESALYQTVKLNQAKASKKARRANTDTKYYSMCVNAKRFLYDFHKVSDVLYGLPLKPRRV